MSVKVLGKKTYRWSVGRQRSPSISVFIRIKRNILQVSSPKISRTGLWCWTYIFVKSIAEQLLLVAFTREWRIMVILIFVLLNLSNCNASSSRRFTMSSVYKFTIAKQIRFNENEECEYWNKEIRGSLVTSYETSVKW